MCLLNLFEKLPTTNVCTCNGLEATTICVYFVPIIDFKSLIDLSFYIVLDIGTLISEPVKVFNPL